MPDAQPIFRTRGPSKTCRSGAIAVQALRGVDFTARAGEFVVILGPSGSGKSTFLNIIGGLDTASEGEAWFQDQNLTGPGEKALTRYRRRARRRLLHRNPRPGFGAGAAGAAAQRTGGCPRRRPAGNRQPGRNRGDGQPSVARCGARGAGCAG